MSRYFTVLLLTLFVFKTSFASYNIEFIQKLNENVFNGARLLKYPLPNDEKKFENADKQFGPSIIYNMKDYVTFSAIQHILYHELGGSAIEHSAGYRWGIYAVPVRSKTLNKSNNFNHLRKLFLLKMKESAIDRFLIVLKSSKYNEIFENEGQSYLNVLNLLCDTFDLTNPNQIIEINQAEILIKTTYLLIDHVDNRKDKKYAL